MYGVGGRRCGSVRAGFIVNAVGWATLGFDSGDTENSWLGEGLIGFAGRMGCEEIFTFLLAWVRVGVCEAVCLVFEIKTDFVLSQLLSQKKNLTYPTLMVSCVYRLVRIAPLMMYTE